jgi:hypothetical protein
MGVCLCTPGLTPMPNTDPLPIVKGTLDNRRTCWIMAVQREAASAECHLFNSERYSPYDMSLLHPAMRIRYAR